MNCESRRLRAVRSGSRSKPSPSRKTPSRWAPKTSGREPREGTRAQLGNAERRHVALPHRMADRDEQVVVRLVLILEVAAHLEVSAAPREHPRNVHVRMVVANPELVAPEKHGAVEHRSAADLGHRIQ